MDAQETYTAFESTRLICRGALPEVVLKIKRRLGKSENSPVLIFSDATGKTIDFNFQGGEEDVLRRLDVYVSREGGKESAGPGRPKLGVISREVSLLPRHWEWLAAQPGGASATLRKLIEEAKKKASASVSIRQVQERAYRFMSVIAGDMEGFEEALRALYRRDRKAFLLHIRHWPRDVKSHVIDMTRAIFERT